MTRLGVGSTIGVVGGGQLARMMALEGRRMGMRVVVLDPDPASSAAQVADGHVCASLDDSHAVARLAAQADVITVDTEHVSTAALREIETIRLVRPSPSVLDLVQDRRAQRMFLTSLEMPQTAHAFAVDEGTLRAAADAVGLPAILKTRRSGYDGRGQARIRSLDDLPAAWKSVGCAPSVLEARVDFEREISVLLARTARGDVRFFPVAENVHRDGILHTTRVPARVTEPVADEARRVAGRIASELDYVGVMAVEFFVGRDGRLLVNELAPRPHNSGHFTFGACATSQFEQHVRAICDLPLGAPDLLRPAVMLNLLGEMWPGSPSPAWAEVLADGAARLHLYGKTPKPRRKIGHVLFVDDDPDQAARAAESAFAALSRGGGDEDVRGAHPAIEGKP